MRHGLQDRCFGDRVEDDALDLDALQRLLAIEDFQHMPGNRLALAVGVSCENELVRAFKRSGYVVQPFLRFGIDIPGHGEVVIRLDRAILGGQVADMAIGGQDLEALAEIFVDGFRL